MGVRFSYETIPAARTDEELEVLDRAEHKSMRRSWGALCGIPGIALIAAVVVATLYITHN